MITTLGGCMGRRKKIHQFIPLSEQERSVFDARREELESAGMSSYGAELLALYERGLWYGEIALYRGVTIGAVRNAISIAKRQLPPGVDLHPPVERPHAQSHHSRTPSPREEAAILLRISELIPLGLTGRSAHILALSELGFSHSAIGALLHIADGTVSSKLHASRMKLGPGVWKIPKEG
jgi:DNA-directed RNA polymerase specialized sigma24 family protein